MFPISRERIATVVSRRLWLITAGVVAVVLIIHSGLDRLVGWDEGVFFSQSGGYRGITAPPMVVGPTREGGPIGLIWALRRLGLDLHSVRIAWILIVLAGAWLAFWLLSRSVGRLYGILGFAVYFSFWIAWVNAGVLHGPMLAGTAGLVALAAYDISVRTSGRPAQAISGLFLGISLSAMFWFRPVESLVTVTAIVLFTIVFDAKEFWWRRPVAWLTTAATLAVGFVIPWSIWSTRLFGSVAARIDGMRGRSAAGGGAFGLRWGVPDWVDLLTGHTRSFGSFAAMPSWSDLVIVAGIVLVLTAAIATAARGTILWMRGDAAAARVRLLSATAFFATGIMYVFVYSEVTERYAILLWAYAAWIVALAAGDVITLFPAGYREVRKAGIIAGVVVITVWLVAQSGIATAFQRGLTDDELAHAEIAQLAAYYVETGACSAGARYNLPLHQILTGCSLTQIFSADSIERAASAIEDHAKTGYIYWIGDADVALNDGWFVPQDVNLAPNRNLWIYREPSTTR